MTVELTATQLRNARKRRSKKKHETGNNKRRRTLDPSLLYLDDPCRAPVVQAARAFFHTTFPVQVGDTTGWRTVAKLAVRSAPGTHTNSQLTIGLFAPGTHTVIPAVPEDDTDDTDNASVHHPAIDAAIRLVQDQARRLGIVPYSEVTGVGQLRHVALAVQRHTHRVQCTLVWNEAGADHNGTATKGDAKDAPPHAPVHRLVQALTAASAKNRCEWHSIWLHGNASNKHDNAIFSHTGAWTLLYSGAKTSKHAGSLVPSSGIDEYLSDCGPVPVPLYFPPHVFRQGNLTAFTAIVQSIRAYVQEQSTSTTTLRCLELYGGVGTIGLHVADLCASLVSSDENPYNVPCFEASARVLLHNLRGRAPVKQGHKGRSTDTDPALPTIRYQSASASRMMELGEHEHVDLIIVDPPRKGLDESVSAALRAAPGQGTSCSRHQTLVYVSCGFDAFRRDYHILTAPGATAWTLDRAEGHVLFPGSNAIETLAFFRRVHRSWSKVRGK